MRIRLIISLFILHLSSLISAHESRPLYLKITQQDSLLSLELNIPNTVNAQNLPVIYLNEKAINNAIKWTDYRSGFRQRWSIDLHGISLKGAQLKIDFPQFNPVLSTIIAISYKDKEEQVLIIPPNKNKVIIPKEVNQSEVRRQYSLLGMEHIWAGVDHLLFLACLLIITGFTRKLFITITGFTIAHSITLILSALKIIQVPIPPIEATIALSIVFLCYEIIHHHQTKKSLTYRYPILVASSFGLLHGLGFAAVLGAIGLPKNHSTEALLFFNVGVEIGQVIFILALFLIVFAIRKISNKLFTDSTNKKIIFHGLRVAIYFVGIIASYWMFDRIV